jgi:hypothetical protein
VAGLFLYEDESSSDISYARNKKASTGEALSAIFRFFSLRTSPRCSGAKVKKETENCRTHACVTFSFALPKKVELLKG